MVMLSDGLQEKKQTGEAAEHVQVLDVAQLLVRSLQRPDAAERAALAPVEAAPETPTDETPAAVGAAATDALAQTFGSPAGGEGS
jgi:hypothetical protein